MASINAYISTKKLLEIKHNDITNFNEIGYDYMKSNTLRELILSVKVKKIVHVKCKNCVIY